MLNVEEFARCLPNVSNTRYTHYSAYMLTSHACYIINKLSLKCVISFQVIMIFRLLIPIFTYNPSRCDVKV